ncbi:MAG: hypothetical protein JWS10_1983 [Cypionkella sp.]|uniref:hypothetical protein n=1 Tax=Cypionkella sp. TaxID=2811411 RepID=UPI0026157597|nr:hypothetical protein [Cypionkella sp.]MDB5659368.1 hypothetical protein [Cypionkella sp.]
MNDDILFWKHEWMSIVEAQKAALRKDVDRLTKSDFEQTGEEELANQLCTKYSLEVPKLGVDDISVKQREINIDVSRDRMRYSSSGGPHYLKGTAIDVRVPFQGDRGMFEIKPNTWTTSIPRGRLEGNSVLFTISGIDLSPAQVKSDIDRQIADLQLWLGFQEQSVGSFPVELAQVAKQALIVRKKKLSADADLISGLGYKME